MYMYTVEPLNNGHIGTELREVILFWGQNSPLWCIGYIEDSGVAFRTLWAVARNGHVWSSFVSLPLAAAVFLVSFLLTGFNLWAAVVILFIVTSIILHMLGSMAVLGINANAVSLVNLVMVR